MSEELFELTYDRTFRIITGYKRLPANTVETVNTDTGDPIWVAHPEKPEYRRFLLQSQVMSGSIELIREILLAKTDYLGALRLKRNHKIDNLLAS